MVRISTYIETHQMHDDSQLIQQEAVRNAAVRTVANAVSYSCCQMARDLGANAIITPSNSGTTARMVARFRPECPIIGADPERAYLSSAGSELRRCADPHGRERRYGRTHQYRSGCR